MAQNFAADYVDVATRIAEVRGEADRKYPEGSFQPADPSQPFRMVTVGEVTFIAYTAAFYRTPDDARPGIGSAWEQVPGRTPYTRGSELQNAETSAWGRALVAALAADTRKGVSSADEVRNRQAEREAPVDPLAAIKRQVWEAGKKAGHTRPADLSNAFAEWSQGELLAEANADALRDFLAFLRKKEAA